MWKLQGSELKEHPANSKKWVDICYIEQDISVAVVRMSTNIMLA